MVYLECSNIEQNLAKKKKKTVLRLLTQMKKSLHLFVLGKPWHA